MLFKEWRQPVSNFQSTLRRTFVAGACAVLFVASMAGMRHLNSFENRAPDFASWPLRGAIAMQ
jgi:hypothetical protein